MAEGAALHAAAAVNAAAMRVRTFTGCALQQALKLRFQCSGHGCCLCVNAQYSPGRSVTAPGTAGVAACRIRSCRHRSSYEVCDGHENLHGGAPPRLTKPVIHAQGEAPAGPRQAALSFSPVQRCAAGREGGGKENETPDAQV